MSVLNKLLNMLDELKEENPELANKALLAAETLKAGVNPEDIEEEWEEEEEFDDSYVEITEEDTKHFLNLRETLSNKLKDYGIYMRDHEVKKTLLLEDIEVVRRDNEEIVDILREKYGLSKEADSLL